MGGGAAGGDAGADDVTTPWAPEGDEDWRGEVHPPEAEDWPSDLAGPEWRMWKDKEEGECDDS